VGKFKFSLNNIFSNKLKKDRFAAMNFAKGDPFFKYQEYS